MRLAFHFGTADHLSEFTIVVPRGKGKKPHETPLGTINPFERTDAGKLQVAALGLAVGARLEYVHDFGDWNEVQLTLERIVPAERGVKYPRTVGSIPPPPDEDEDDEW